jgi:hypothetical protein
LPSIKKTHLFPQISYFNCQRPLNPKLIVPEYSELKTFCPQISPQNKFQCKNFPPYKISQHNKKIVILPQKLGHGNLAPERRQTFATCFGGCTRHKCSKAIAEAFVSSFDFVMLDEFCGD